MVLSERSDFCDLNYKSINLPSLMGERQSSVSVKVKWPVSQLGG